MNVVEGVPSLNARERVLFAALLTLVIAPFWLNGYLNTQIAHSPVLYWGFELLSWLVIPAMAAWAAHRYLGVTWTQVGLTFCLFGKRCLVLLAVLCVVCAFSFHWVYSTADAWFSKAFPGPAYFDYQTLIPESGPSRLLVALYYAVSAGIVEEILYRGALFRLMEGLPGATSIYLVLSPVIFSSIHWEGGASNLAATYVVGLFAGLLFLAFRNLIPLMVGHAVTDYAWFT
jgi:hypothetical protein